jgi:hypothetical protein
MVRGASCLAISSADSEVIHATIFITPSKERLLPLMSIYTRA